MTTLEAMPTHPISISQNDTLMDDHICALCKHKERVYVTSPDGSQYAAIWRCRELSQRFQQEILVTPTGSCYEAKSLSDYWEADENSALVW